MTPSTALLDEMDTWAHYSHETEKWYLAPAQWVPSPRDVVADELARRLGVHGVRDRTRAAPPHRAAVADILEAFRQRCAETQRDVPVEDERGASESAQRWNGREGAQ